MRFRFFLLAVACLITPIAAQARQTPPAPQACTAQDADLPAGLAGWRSKSPLTAASSEDDLAGAALNPDRAYLATLSSTSAVTYIAQPQKPGDPVSHGGLFDLTVPVSGTYVIALGAGAWVDVLRDGAPVESVSHSHGPACSTLRKIVAFDLRPGRYVVQITGSVPEVLPIMVAKRP